MKKITLFVSLLVIGISACKKEEDTPLHKTWIIANDAAALDNAQTALIQMADYDTIHFNSGIYSFNLGLDVSDKTGVVIRGEGRDATILDFSGQLSGAQGIMGDHLNQVIFANLTVQDAPGDGIKVKDSDGVAFINVGAVFTGDADSTNGAYGIYPVASKNILLDNCYVRGASDAGIYVGQSEFVHVKNCLVQECVAGCEIENCKSSDVYDNEFRNNAGGLLIFDLPNLPVIPNGYKTRAYNNFIHDNNHKNFAPPGNIVANVPPGSGVIILSASEAEIFNNEIKDNNIMSIGIISYTGLSLLDPSLSYTDAAYDPFNYLISLHDNEISKQNVYPADQNALSDLLISSVPNPADLPVILFDGLLALNTSEELRKICIDQSADDLVYNVITDVVMDMSAFDCTISPLPEVVIDVPSLP